MIMEAMAPAPPQKNVVPTIYFRNMLLRLFIYLAKVNDAPLSQIDI